MATDHGDLGGDLIRRTSWAEVRSWFCARPRHASAPQAYREPLAPLRIASPRRRPSQAATTSGCTKARGGSPYALIENVVTDAAHRGRGFGRRVLCHAVSAAWDQGCYKVMLMTGAKDPGTLRFYAKAGFEQSKTGFQVRRVPERLP